MAIRLRIPKRSDKSGKPTTRFSFRDPLVKAAFTVFAVLAALIIGVFSYYYITYDRIITRRFNEKVFSTSAKIYAIPQTVRLGEKISEREIAADLRHAGYAEKDGDSPLGSYRMLNNGIEVRPGPQSYHSPEPATIRFSGGKVDSITGKNGELGAYELEPEMITSLFDAGQRSKRQLVKYEQIPKVLVDAVVSIEDRRFFQHGGVNFVRLAEAGWIDFTHQRHQQGGSTLTDATFPRVLSHSGEDHQAQAGGNSDRDRTGAEVRQKADL